MRISAKLFSAADRCFPWARRSASVAPLSSRYSDLPTHKRFSVGRVIAVPGRGALSLWTYSAIPTGVNGPQFQTTAVLLRFSFLDILSNSIPA